MADSQYDLTAEQLKTIHETLQKGDRVELIPLKDKIKVIRVKREEVKAE